MGSMTTAFISCGTKAVLELCADDGVENETCLMETNLNLRIAEKLKNYDDNFDVRSDPFYYTIILKLMGHDVSSPDIVQTWGQLSADIGVFQEESNPVLLEVKQFSDNSTFKGVINDRDKLQRLAKIALFDGYVGVHVCQDRSTNIRETIKTLEVQLGFPVSVGEILQTKCGAGWEWAFVCAKITGLPAV